MPGESEGPRLRPLEDRHQITCHVPGIKTVDTTSFDKTQAGRTSLRGVSNSALVAEAARKALTQEELAKTIARCKELCAKPGEDVRELEEVTEVIRNAGFKNELMNLLREALDQPGTNPHVGALWIRRLVLSKIWDHRYPEGLDELSRHGEIGHRAVIEFLKLAGSKHRSELVERTVGHHGKWLRQDPVGWAVAARALVEARSYRKAVHWFGGWRARPDLDLPTLRCLALALRATGRRKDADEVVRAALSRPEAASFPIFRLWAAQEDALQGKTQSASAELKQVDTSGWEDDELALFYLVRGVVRVQKAAPEDRRESFQTARDRVRDIFRRVPVYKRDVYLRREYRRCLNRMAGDSGQMQYLVPTLWRSAESSWLMQPLLVIPGLQLLLPCYCYRLWSRRRGVLK